jgi:hypothetical protein
MVKSNDVAVKAQREAAGERVITSFGNLPDLRLLCFFDDIDWQLFKDRFGRANRGFYGPLTEGPLPEWSDYLRQQIFVPMQAPKLAFDHVIYLHGSTCSNVKGLTMTFAHELQHFAQHSNSLKLWAANSLVPNLPKHVIDALGLRWCDIPHEREARIISKRIAEQLFGAEAVAEFIDAKIAECLATDGDDWKCIQGLVTSTVFDLASETKLFFPRLKDYRQDLEKALCDCQKESDPDFEGIDLGALLSGSEA